MIGLDGTRTAGNAPPVLFKDIYGGGGASSSEVGAPMSPAQMADPSDMIPGESELLVPLQKALGIGLGGEPVKYWIALAALLIGGMWLLTRFGNINGANIKFSFYNLAAVTLIGIVGGSIAKVLVTRFPIPGVTPIVLAA